MTSLVVDAGSGNTRVGLSGAELPAEVFATQVEAGNDVDGVLMPIKRGIVHDWAGVERLWELIYGKMDAQSKDQPVIVTDSPTVKERDRNKMAELLFEKFEVPAYFVGSQSVLSLYAEGRTWGIVVDTGYGVTHTMAVHEGFAFPHTICQMDLGGSDLANNMVELLGDRGIDMDEFGGKKSATDVILQHGRLALDYASEAMQYRMKPGTAPTYTLPDGRAVQLEAEHIRATEALFQPVLAGCRGSGIADQIWEAIELCDGDREGGPMRKLSQFVLVTGGCSLFPGMQERLKSELDAKAGAPRDIFITAMSVPERHHAAWIGASILASLPQFVENNFVARAEYLEDGDNSVTKRCC